MYSQEKEQAIQIFEELAEEVPAVKVGLYHFAHNGRVVIFVDGKFSESIDIRDTGAYDYFPGVENYEKNWRASKRKALKLIAAKKKKGDSEGIKLTALNLKEVDLQGANLSKAEMSRVNFYNANLTGANLSEADLRMANLTSAQLNQANLMGANLLRANLGGTNLSQANLCQANLEKASIFQGTHILETNLEDAIYDNDTIWPTDFNPSTTGAINIDDPANRSVGS